jgi:hypothetical protein
VVTTTSPACGQHSIPADRIKNHALTASQVDVTKLGTVPTAAYAAHAGTADSATTAAEASHATAAGVATHAGRADEAEHAKDASTLGGLDAKAFMPPARCSPAPGRPGAYPPRRS